MISDFQKVKVWAAMRYRKLSKLVVVSERERDGKMNANDYVNFIMDEEMFDFWMKSCEELGQVIIMKDGAGYHNEIANVRRRELEKDG